MEDTEWLELCGRNGWVVLAKDKNIRRRPVEIQCIQENAVKAFVIPVGGLTAAEQVERLLKHERTILEYCLLPGPFVAAVEAQRITWRLKPSGR